MVCGMLTEYNSSLFLFNTLHSAKYLNIFKLIFKQMSKLRLRAVK